MRHRNATPRTDREEYDRERALAVLARMRRENLPLNAAAKLDDFDPATVRRYVGSALKRKGGSYRASLYDRLPRALNFLSPTGTRPITVRDSRTASRIGEYMNAVRAYVYSGDTSSLADFEGRSFRSGGVTRRFVTDTKSLDQLADAGGLAIEGLYRAVQGG